MDPFLSHNGFLVIDKPKGITSHDVVQVVRRQLGTRKVGHLGTLDPMATGVLPTAVGKATRLIEFLKAGTKVYEGEIQLGFSTDTYDCQGQPTSESVVPCTCQEQLSELALQMSGEQLQVAPPFSAKKIQGVRAYRLARKGVEVDIAPHRVQIDVLTFLLREPNHVDFTIRCSAGTYVRSVAHDLGHKLGCGAHLSRLRRLASGEFLEDQAVSLDDLTRCRPADLSKYMIPLNKVLPHVPAVVADSEIEKAMRVGCDFNSLESSKDGSERRQGLHRVLDCDGRLLGLAKATAALFHPVVVLTTTGE